jgi:hypothetical protein
VTVLKAMGLALAVALMLPLAASCGDSDEKQITGGTAGTGGTGGTGGTRVIEGEPEATITAMCDRLATCNQLGDSFSDGVNNVPVSEDECRQLQQNCVDDVFQFDAQRKDWARQVRGCLAIEFCSDWRDCWFNLDGC